MGYGIGGKLFNNPIFPLCTNTTATEEIVPGMTLAIKPIVIENKRYKLKPWLDGWTLVTEDGSWSAQYGQTVHVTHNGAELLT